MQLSKLWLACALASSMAITGCSDSNSSSGDDVKKVDPPVEESPQSPETPEEPAITTSFNVTVVEPNLGDANLVRSFAALTAQNTDLDRANFAVTVVDTAGNVIEVVELTSDNLIKNSDGSWTIVLPGNPQLNCLVVVDLNKPIVITPQQPLPPGVVFVPTVSSELEVSIESTAAYQAFLDSLADDQTFADLGFDITDAESLALVEQLLVQVQDAYDGLINSRAFDPQAFTSVDDVLERIEQQIATIVEQEVANAQNPSDSQLADALAASQSLYEFEGQLPGSPSYARLNETGEVRFTRNDREELPRFGPQAASTTPLFTESSYQNNNEGHLLLTANGWEQLADWVKTEAQEDGSIIVTDLGIDTYKEQYTAARAIELNGRNISDFLSIDPDTQLTGFVMQEGAEFGDGAIAYQLAERTLPEETALLFCDAPEECEPLFIPPTNIGEPSIPEPPVAVLMADQTSGNLFEQRLLKEAAAEEFGDLVAIPLGTDGPGPLSTVIAVELLTNNEVKFHTVTVEFDPSVEGPVTPVLAELATGSWQYRELAVLSEDEQVLTFELPAVVRQALQDKVEVDFRNGPFASEPALENYPEGTQYLIAEYNGELVSGSYTPAGTNVATSGYIFNQAAGEAIVNAFDEAQLSDLPLINDLALYAQSGFGLLLQQALLCEPASFSRNPISERTFTIVNNYCRALQRSAIDTIAAQEDNSSLPDVMRNAEVEEFIRTEQVSGQSWYYGFAFDSRIQQLTFNADGSLSVAEVIDGGNTQETGITATWTLENGKLHVVANIPAIGDDEAYTLTRVIELLLVSEVGIDGVLTEVFFFHELLNDSSAEGQDGEGLLIPAVGSLSLTGLREFQRQLPPLPQ